MIITSIVSGFGNQLFQYAAGYSVARRLGSHLKLDLRFYQTSDLRKYELHRLNISGTPISMLDRVRMSVSHEGTPHGFLRKSARLLPIRRLRTCTDHGESLSSGFQSAGDFTFLIGYWQNPEYFSGIADELRREFRFKNLPDADNAFMLERIHRTNAICVHVRRGDYLTGKEILKACSTDYYVDAVAWMNTKVPDAEYFVFTDDPNWARSHLPIPERSTFVTHNIFKNDPEDLRLMSACRHFIIANSTFSWWGAWLSQSHEKIVIAPRRWYAIDHPNEQSIIPREWIRV